jgi:hypothetical protein
VAMPNGFRAVAGVSLFFFFFPIPHRPKFLLVFTAVCPPDGHPENLEIQVPSLRRYLVTLAAPCRCWVRERAAGRSGVGVLLFGSLQSWGYVGWFAAGRQQTDSPPVLACLCFLQSCAYSTLWTSPVLAWSWSCQRTFA